MRLVIALLVIVFSACSNSNNTDQKTSNKIKAPHSTSAPKPAIVPVTEEQVVNEFDRLESNRKTNDPQQRQVVENMRRRTIQQYGNKPMSLVLAGTDSVSGGLDGWRTCAKFGLKQLGLPAGSIATFNDQNGVSCEKNPNGYVSQIVIIGPEGIEEKIGTPTYKTEKMTVMIGSVVLIKGK